MQPSQPFRWLLILFAAEAAMRRDYDAARKSRQIARYVQNPGRLVNLPYVSIGGNSDCSSFADGSNSPANASSTFATALRLTVRLLTAPSGWPSTKARNGRFPVSSRLTSDTTTSSASVIGFQK